MKGAGSESEAAWVIRGRSLTSSDVGCAQRLVEEYFRAGRTRIAYELAHHWQWRSGSGRLKVRAALAVLVALEQRRCLSLPPPLRVHGPVGGRRCQVRVDHDVTALAGALSDYRPLRWQLVQSTEQRRQWREVLDRHHYLGAPGLVGAHLGYLVYSRGGDLLGAIGWQSAVERLDCRDQVVGVNGHAAWRSRFLIHAVNNVRFLVLPWVKVRHLASALLGEALKHLQKDWLRHYGAPVWWAESFVDRTCFNGACYRAAHWVALGWTRGYAKQQGQFIYHGQPKEIYVYVIEKRIRQLLLEDPAQELLTREYLLAQRPPGNPQPQAKRKSMSEMVPSWTPKLPPQWELSVEDLECVRQDLNEFTARFKDTFRRIEPRELCQRYLQGLLSGAARKNVEAMALELEGPEIVRNLQRFISDYEWEESWLREQHWKVAAESLADAQGVWSIDASEFPKKGEHSVGVAAQYCGALGKTANCQSGVFICYSSPKGHALLDSQLYLPQCWFTEASQARREKCRLPENITFQTKPQIALGLCAPLWQGKLFPGQWVTCDASFGNNEAFLAELPKEMLYLAEISCTRKVWLKAAPPPWQSWETEGCLVEQLVAEKDLLHWQSRKLAEGEKGPLVASFARIRVYVSRERTAENERTLFLRNDPDGKIKYALSNAPEDVPMSELIRVSAARWPIERCFQEGKSELGLDHYEHRSWPAWHRHMRLVFLAQLFLIRLRLKYKKSPGADVAASARASGVEFTSPERPSRLRPELHSVSPAT